MKHTFTLFIICVLALSCSKIPNKSIFEPLSDKELHQALKDESFSSMYHYCFGVGSPYRNQLSDMSQLRRVELMDVSYRSFTKYFKCLDSYRDNFDTLAVCKAWEARYGTEEQVIERLDSIKTEWEEFIRLSQLWNHRSLTLPKSIWEKTIYEMNNHDGNSDPGYLLAKWNDEGGVYLINKQRQLNFEIYKECFHPFIEPFAEYFIMTYIFEDSDFQKKYPKESELFQYIMPNIKGTTAGLGSWPWAYMYYDNMSGIYNTPKDNFPPNWSNVQGAFKIELYAQNNNDN